MDRVACVYLADFQLQTLLQDNPGWAKEAVVVVDKDALQGRVMAVNTKAIESGVDVGARYGQGLALNPNLRAGVICGEDIERRLLQLQHAFEVLSPAVEMYPEEPGVLWLDAAGLGRLFKSASKWLAALKQTIKRSNYEGHVVLGFRRFSTYALAKSVTRPVVLLKSQKDETRAMQDVRIEYMGIHRKGVEGLAKLGVYTLGQLATLPKAALYSRFGEEIASLQAKVHGEQWDPLRPAKLPESYEHSILLDDGVKHSEGLLDAIEPVLARLFDRLSQSGLAMQVLYVEFVLERGEPRRLALEPIQPAEANLRLKSWLRLLELRFEHTTLREGVIEIHIGLQPASPLREQLKIFETEIRSQKERAAGNEAIACIRAQYGNDSVCVASPRDSHFPETSFAWSSAHELQRPQELGSYRPVMVRRLFEQPQPLSYRPSFVRESCPKIGPYILSSNWWTSIEERHYYFVDTSHGWRWVYWDAVAKRWYSQGGIE